MTNTSFYISYAYNFSYISNELKIINGKQTMIEADNIMHEVEKTVLSPITIELDVLNEVDEKLILDRQNKVLLHTIHN